MTNTTLNVPRELLERVLYLMDNYIGTTHTEEDELRAILSAPSPAGVDVCKGKSCGATDGVSHSAECFAEHERAYSCAGVDGPVRNFKTREGYDVWDKLCAIPKFGFLIGPSGGVVKVEDIGNWIDRDEAQSVVDEAQCEVNLLRHEASDAQAIIDGLRGEVAEQEEAANQWRELALQFDRHRMTAMAHIRAAASGDKSAIEALGVFAALPPIPGHEITAARDQQAQRIGELEGLLRHAQKQVQTGSGLHMRIDAALSASKEGE